MIFSDLISLNLASDQEIQMEAELDHNKVKKVSYLIPKIEEYKEKQYTEPKSNDEEIFDIEELEGPEQKKKGPQPLMKMKKE